MKVTKKTHELPISELLVKMEKKRKTYRNIALVMIGLAVIGVIISLILEETEPGWMTWLPVNLGTYGIGGICAVYLFLLIAAALATFLSCIRDTGIGLIGSAVISMLVYGVGFTLFEKVVVWLYRSINTNFEVSFFGTTLNGAAEIPVSGTLGAALLNTVLYTLPCLYCVVQALIYSRKVSQIEMQEKQLSENSNV